MFGLGKIGIRHLNGGTSTLIGLLSEQPERSGLRNAKFKGKKLIMNTIYFPIVIPEIVLAVALLLVFNLSNIGLSIGTIIIGNTTLVLPYVYITVKARLVGMDPSIEEASMDLECRPCVHIPSCDTAGDYAGSYVRRIYGIFFGTG